MRRNRCQEPDIVALVDFLYRKAINEHRRRNEAKDGGRITQTAHLGCGYILLMSCTCKKTAALSVSVFVTWAISSTNPEQSLIGYMTGAADLGTSGLTA